VVPLKWSTSFGCSSASVAWRSRPPATLRSWSSVPAGLPGLPTMKSKRMPCAAARSIAWK
jgi:hypothetical protein